MLQNAILAGGTWPRSRSNQNNKHEPSNHWNISHRLQKPAKHYVNNRKVVIHEEDTDFGFIDCGDAEQSKNNIEAPMLTYDLLSSGPSSSQSSEHDLLFSDDYLGVSFDSCTSYGDIFGSFDTVSAVSNLSLYTDADQVEKCLADLRPRKISVDSTGVGYFDKSRRDSQNCIFDYNFENGSLHGSFSNVSMCAVDSSWTYGIRDLRSETHLHKLKEHIISGQRNKDQNENYLRVNQRKLNRLSKSESDLCEKSRDVLIPLSAGHITYERTSATRQPRPKRKVFSSKEELEPDYEAMSLNYHESLCFLRRKDIESCRVTGPGVQNGTAGKKATFYIFTEKDKQENLKIYITGPRLVPPDHEITTLTDCFYSVSYFPDRVGSYCISVLWRGKHVPGSPFHVVMLLQKRKVWFKMNEQ